MRKSVLKLDEFRFVTQKFYRGGEFENLLNEAVDQSLFTESFVVFYEIDSQSKEHKVLFPIVTLIIMGGYSFQKNEVRTKITEKPWSSKKRESKCLTTHGRIYTLSLQDGSKNFWGERLLGPQELGEYYRKCCGKIV